MMEVEDMEEGLNDEAIMDHEMNLAIHFHHQLRSGLPLDHGAILQTQDYETNIRTVVWDRKEGAHLATAGEDEAAIRRVVEEALAHEVLLHQVDLMVADHRWVQE
jgi:hypothetical protein